MKVIFLGTPGFVLPVLEDLQKQHEVVAVFCQPDKKGNRGKITVSPTKTFALQNNIEVFQPDKIDFSVIEKVKELKPDVMIVAAYGKILSQDFLDIAPVLNIHPSDLPKYRGSSPIQWALINGETKIAVSVMKLCFKMDAGDILKKEYLEILKDDNAQTLLEKSFKLGSKLLIETLNNLSFCLENATKQNENEATVFPMLKKEDGKILFSKTSNEIVNLVKGLYVWPNAFCFLNGKVLKVFVAESTSYDSKSSEGEVVLANKSGIVVGCKNGFVLFKEVQIENGKRMSAGDFVNGKNIKVGDVLC